MNLENTTKEELANILITLDGKGKEVKLAALNELLFREREFAHMEGYNLGRSDVLEGIER
jgi:hypothetical protein